MISSSAEEIIGYVSHDVTDKLGRLLLAEGAPLTNSMAERLRKRNINYRLSTRSFGSLSHVDPIAKLPIELDRKFDCLDIECVKNASQCVASALSVVRKNTVLHSNIKVLAHVHRETYAHSINTAIIAAAIGEKLGFSRRTLRDLAVGALFHDVGKMLLPPSAFSDPSEFQAGEMYLYQQHSVVGADLLSADKLQPGISLTVRQHHEQYSGCGYPDGLKGSEIHINACIVSVANAFDRLTTTWRGRVAFEPNEAMDGILICKGTEFHPFVVDSFVEIFKRPE